jgi:DNA-binding CsgD family transcriptional regulator
VQALDRLLAGQAADAGDNDLIGSQIARAENIGVGTVEYHVNDILSKLNVSCRTEAACVAARRGLIHTF